MKKLLVLLFAFLVQTFYCHAQKIRFTDTSNRWTYVCLSDPTPPLKYSHSEYYGFMGDTISNGKQYYSLNGIYIREDTVSRKVFIWNPAANDDVIFMDFSLNISDTLKRGIYYCVLAGKDSIIINNTWHIRQSFQVYDTAGQMLMPLSIIEGIGGSDNGLFYPLCPGAIEPICLFCSLTQNTTTVFSNQFYCTLNIDEPSWQGSKISISPNPITPHSKIILPYMFSSGVLSIFDFTGRKIYRQEFSQKEELPIGHLDFTPGIYFLHVQDGKNSRVFTGKFVRQ